eukprot:CAMPEP_0172519984 /NCGR_PEP_ID=MMETSP1066-20121228/291737_1 /TAXON_ID=671091 /ORGANISM="Coscinodiscus wailesii, Strain CCMP2513" /LENGTH=177 /DNA_ID=CAMNT_0013302663 /DNA_START=919 /DNA_END=1452 /DNA_ORIENTATION=-
MFEFLGSLSNLEDDHYGPYDSPGWMYIIFLLSGLILLVSQIVIVRYSVENVLPQFISERLDRFRSQQLIVFGQMQGNPFFSFLASVGGVLYNGVVVAVTKSIGIHSDQDKDADGPSIVDHEWMGRLAYIEESTERIMSEFESRNNEQMRLLEEKLVLDIIAMKDEFLKHVTDEDKNP